MKAGVLKKIGMVVIVLIVLLIVGLIGFVEVKKQIDAKKVTAYLINDKGYREDELLCVRGRVGKLPVFSVSVIFKDEPLVQYWYTLDQNGGIKTLPPSLSEDARQQGLRLPEEYRFKHYEIEQPD